MSFKEVRKERTGWRDEALSARHRDWGWDCPAVDLDFLMLEYDQGKAVALVEYKNQHAKPQKPKHPSFRAMADLGDRAQIPVFAVRYGDGLSWFLVVPLNYLARALVPERIRMSEMEYVTLLYQLRHREVPENVLAVLTNVRAA